MQIAQIALSCRDHVASRAWYVECLGYLPSGGMDFDAMPEPPDVAAIQGLPEVSAELVWAVDGQEFFQLEFFRYRRPEPRPTCRRACDIGYRAIGVHVEDFDAALRCLSPPVGAIVGEQGARRACFEDPCGVLVEVMEDGEARSGPATRFVRASVPELEPALAYFADTLGMQRHDRVLHGPEHEALWALEGAPPQLAVLSAGDLWLELACYDDAAPWPEGYRLSDLGLVNVALGTRSREEYHAVRDRVTAAGYRVHQELEVEIGSTIYTENEQGFSVEIMYVDPAADAMTGFASEL
jgi:catechol 2,3-dioxygenase-like lactoylglutathione lyase family enzyme